MPFSNQNFIEIPRSGDSELSDLGLALLELIEKFVLGAVTTLFDVLLFSAFHYQNFIKTATKVERRKPKSSLKNSVEKALQTRYKMASYK